MDMRTLKALAAIVGGGICFSTALFGQPASGTVQAPASPAAPTVQDSINNAAPGANDVMKNPARFTEAEILGVVLAVDDNEIAAASKAEKKQLSADARSYANMLHKQHAENADQTRKLGKQLGLKPVGTPTADQLRAQGKAELKALSAMQGKDFEKAYIDAMVQGHTDALQLIDAQLIPSAQSEALQKHLAATRDHVAAHLEQGKRLQEAQASRQE
ncbi:MAG TPA: DUF4142 domain-containing protein [Fibrobacteria bacterium]|nr:DUF4142 domain-containing protein [Fibrobacteria bacterium]